MLAVFLLFLRFISEISKEMCYEFLDCVAQIPSGPRNKSLSLFFAYYNLIT